MGKTDAEDKYFRKSDMSPAGKSSLYFDSLTMVVSAMEPKLLMKILQLTFTGGPANQERFLLSLTAIKKPTR
jgi:hypothetical protein